MEKLLRPAPILFTMMLLGACSDNGTTEVSSQSSVATPIANLQASTSGFNADRNAYFGDLHVHTMYSYDAFIFGTTSSPDDAYTFAKGGALTHPAGFDMKLDVPLDFYAVTDHAYYLGIFREMAVGDSAVSRHPVAQGMASLGDDITERRALFARIRDFSRSERNMEIMDLDIV